MRALILTKNDLEIIENILKSTYSSKIEVFKTSSVQEVKDRLFEQGAHFPVILNADEYHEVSDIIDLIVEDIGECPIALIGTNDGLDHKKIKENAMVTRFSHPIDPKDFKALVDGLITEKQSEEEDNSVTQMDAENFVSLRIRSFYLYSSLPYDAYMNVTDNRFMRVISKNTPYNQATIQKLKEKNVRYLYLEKDNHITFLENSIEKIKEKMTKKSSYNLTIYMKTFVEAAALFQDYILHIGVSDNLYSFIDIMVEFYITNIERLENIGHLYKVFNKKNPDISEQAIFKAMYCGYVARKLTWTSNSTRAKILLTSLIHDIYIAEPEHSLVIDLQDRTLSEPDKKHIIKHVLSAQKIAEQFTNYSDISFLVGQHHQIPDSRAFPGAVSLSKISQLSGLFIIINHFVSTLILRGNKPETRRSLVKEMELVYVATTFKNAFQEFKKSFK